MNSKAIKSFFASLGLKVRCRTYPYICVWISPEPMARLDAPLVYKTSFPEDFRRTCLGVIYGFDTDLAKQVTAGNVCAHSIAMHAHEWEQAVDIHLNHPRVAIPDYEL